MGKLRNLILKDEVCPWWLIWTFDNPLRKLIQKPDAILAGLIKPGDTAVDIGCGIGYFTIPIAIMAGARGKVIAVDLQDRMLAGMKKRAEKNGVAERITGLKCTPDSLGVKDPADFVLAFYMVHEVPDQKKLFNQIVSFLKPGGRLLIVEPRMHVSEKAFDNTKNIADECGLTLKSYPAVKFSRAALFEK